MRNKTHYIFLLLCCLLHSMAAMDPFTHQYNLSLKTKCLVAPPWIIERQGLVLNNGVEDDSETWNINGDGASKEMLHRIHLHHGHIYGFSAWVKMRSEEEKKVEVVFKMENGSIVHGGQVKAKQECWSLLQGGIVPNVSGPVDIFFQVHQSNAKEVKISITNVSLQHFTKEEWKFKQDQLINKIRKSKVRFEVTYRNKTAIKDAQISIQQIKPAFLLGCGMNFKILLNEQYRKWFASRFKITSFTNEMKWYSTEIVRGQENYTKADLMLKFAEENGILVRGHTVLWDQPTMQPSWVQNITDPEDLMNATLNRINSVMTRYKGKVTGWDVVNENVHWDFFEKILGLNISSRIYNLASKLDPDVTLFVNEFNSIENPKEVTATAIKVKEKMEEILAFPGNKKLKGGIGAQGHFSPIQPNLAYMRSALDTLGSLGLPLWLTELDMPKCPDQARYMEDILREAYSHPAVDGIIIFAGPEVSGFDKLTLADKDFKNTEMGDVIDKLLNEWKQKPLENIEEGKEVSLLHGHYKVNLSHPLMKNLSASLSFEVTKEKGQHQMVRVVIDD